MTEGKLSKKEIEKAKSILSILRKQKKEREDRYKKNLEAEREKTKKTYKSINKAIQIKKNRLRQLEKSNKKDKEKIKKKIISGIIMAEKEKEKRRKEQQKQESKKKLLTIGSKIESGIGIGLEKVTRKIAKGLSKKVTYRKPKSKKMTLKIKDYNAPSILGDENRFFKGEMIEEKRSMFI